MNKVCVVCGVEFDALGRAKTCGEDCGRANKNARKKAYRQTPGYKTIQKEYTQTAKYKAYQKAYRQSPEWNAYMKAYRRTPEHKAYQKAYMKAYRQKSEYKAYCKVYMKAYHNEQAACDDFFTAIAMANAVKEAAA
jgi:hypothetical protein